MAAIVWSEKYEIGIPVIDKQHRRIVDYINDLDAQRDEPDRAVVGKVIADLVDYTYSHFAFEEALMEEAGYEFVSIHQRTHTAFCTRLETLRESFDREEDVATALAELLGTWLLQHIATDDSSYAPTVKQKILGLASHQEDGWLRDALRRFFG